MLVGLLALALVGVGIFFIASRSGDSEASQTSSSSGASELQACEDSIRVSVPGAYRDAWTSVIASYAQELQTERAESGEDDTEACTPIRVLVSDSATIASGTGTVLDAWIPEDASWIQRAQTQGVTVHGKPTTVAASPVVMALPYDSAAKLGGAQTLLRPTTLRPLVRGDRKVPGDKPAAMAIAMPDPNTSATGALGFAALGTAASGRKEMWVPDYADPTTADFLLIRSENRIVGLGADDAAVLAGELEDPSAKPNTFITSEQAVWAHNQASPGDQMRATYFNTAQAAIRMPLVAMNADAQPAVQRFAEFLDSEAGVAALNSSGLRSADLQRSPASSAAMSTVSYTAKGRPSTGEEVGFVGTMFSVMHQRISSMIVLDASGSMLQPLPGTDKSKIQVIREAGVQSIKIASPRARTGLVSFHSDDQDNMIVKLDQPIGVNGQIERGRPHSSWVHQRLINMRVGGGTPLYNGIRLAYSHLAKNYAPGQVNQLVVLSDGRNQDANGSISLQRLLNYIERTKDPEKPLRVIAVGIGMDADMAALQQIADATDGRAVALQHFAQYHEVLRTALFSI